MKRKRKCCKTRINIQKRAAMLIIIGTLSMISACGVSRQQDDPAINAVQFQNALTVTPEQAESLELSDADLSEMSSISEQKGVFTGEAAGQLLPEQEELLRGYMEAYYQSLTELQAQNLSSLFLENAEEQILMNESATAYVTGLREMQDADLHLADYQYELNVTLVQEAGGTTEVQLTETSTQNFAQSPDVDSMLYNIRHVFLLAETEEGWKIAEHWQRDNIYRNLLGTNWSWEDRSLTMEDPEAYFPEQVELLLTEARQEKLQRTGRNQTADLAVDYPYQREAAVSYSDIWVGQRNTEWSDFTGRGGNCQNFVSQCLLAGGIPMDDQGDAVWSWDSEGNHSASWVGVDEFYRYASQNSGYGLLAEADAGYYDGEAGDLIRMGSDTDWNHVVIIAEVIRDQEGNVVDYLINSNTSDVKNFPVSAYPNVKQRLMKIYGWNET